MIEPWRMERLLKEIEMMDEEQNCKEREAKQHERDVARGKAGTKQVCKSCGKSAFSSECGQCRKRRMRATRVPCVYCGRACRSGLCWRCKDKGLLLPPPPKPKPRPNPLIVREPSWEPNRKGLPGHLLRERANPVYPEPVYVHPVTRFSEPRQFSR